MILTNRLFEREQPSREARSIYIFCEGARREYQYFEYFKEIVLTGKIWSMILLKEVSILESILFTLKTQVKMQRKILNRMMEPLLLEALKFSNYQKVFCSL